jgi:hypothetical protein
MRNKATSAVIVVGVVLGALMLSSCTTLAPWKQVPTGSSVVYGQIEDSRRAISFLAYSDDPGIIAITMESRFGGWSPRYGMVVDQPARNTMREALAKFDEWSRLAQENGVEITREINSVTLPQMFYRSKGWEAEGERQVTFVFRSALGDSSTPRTALIIRTRSFFYGSDQATLSTDQAADFARYLGDEEITMGYRQAKKKQDTLDMFK